jgi:hypothetical protein
MARQAGVYDCWAAYGAAYSPLDMATLVKVTNWPLSMVKKVLNSTPDRLNIHPSCVIESFKEVVGIATKHPPVQPNGRRPAPESAQLPLFELGAESVLDH